MIKINMDYYEGDAEECPHCHKLITVDFLNRKLDEPNDCHYDPFDLVFFCPYCNKECGIWYELNKEYLYVKLIEIYDEEKEKEELNNARRFEASESAKKDR